MDKAVARGCIPIILQCELAQFFPMALMLNRERSWVVLTGAYPLSLFSDSESECMSSLWWDASALSAVGLTITIPSAVCSGQWAPCERTHYNDCPKRPLALISFVFFVDHPLCRPAWLSSVAIRAYVFKVCEVLLPWSASSWLKKKQPCLHMPLDQELKNCKLI